MRKQPLFLIRNLKEIHYIVKNTVWMTAQTELNLFLPFMVAPFLLILFQVDRQSQFIQGYRVMYRQTSGLTSPSAWQTVEVNVPTERSAILINLKKGVTYDIKVRPYFNEFQGMDSESKSARTTEEGKKIIKNNHMFAIIECSMLICIKFCTSKKYFLHSV